MSEKITARFLMSLDPPPRVEVVARGEQQSRVRLPEDGRIQTVSNTWLLFDKEPKPLTTQQRPVAVTTAGTAFVYADGKSFGSVFAAFAALGLKTSRHQKFRAELKKARRLVYEEDGRKVVFEYR